MNPNEMKIAVLAADRMVTTYEWTSTTESNVEAVIHAAFDHPRAGRVDAYAKFYRADGRGMVNEVTGWLLARAYGLPVPENAFIAFVPLAALPKPLVGIAALASEHGHDQLPAFCTQSAAIGVRPILETAALIEEIKRWSHVYECVAFDERSANADRHVKNLVRRGLRDFVAIDHGRLAWRDTQPEWSASALDPLADYANRLSEIIWGARPDDKDSSAVMAAACQLDKDMPAIQSELAYWWSIMISNEDDRAAWASFVYARLEHVEYLLRKRFGLLT